MGYTQTQPASGVQGMGVPSSMYGGAPVVSFPSASVASPVIAPPAPPAAKTFYRMWDNVQRKYFYWEKDSTVTSWTEPPAHINLIEYDTGALVRRDAPQAAQPVAANVTPSAPVARSGIMVDPAIVAASAPNTQRAMYSSRPKEATTVSQPVNRSIDPTYSAGVSRYTTQNADSLAAAAERARIEEADRLIAEKLQKQLSLEAENELFASCPLPGEAAAIIGKAAQKKKAFGGASAAKAPENDDKLIADMAESGFVVKKVKQKKNTKATINP